MLPSPPTIQREIANSYASNADLVHKSVVHTEEGRKRYAEQVGYDIIIIYMWY